MAPGYLSRPRLDDYHTTVFQCGKLKLMSATRSGFPERRGGEVWCGGGYGTWRRVVNRASERFRICLSFLL